MAWIAGHGAALAQGLVGSTVLLELVEGWWAPATWHQRFGPGAR